MIINSINNNNSQKINFKSVYPVVIWKKLPDGTTTRVKDAELIKALSRKLVRYTNGTLSRKNEKNADLMDRTFAYLTQKDPDLKATRKSTLFHYVDNKYPYKVYNYLVTGNQAESFSKSYGKPIGESKVNYGIQSKEVKDKKFNYLHNGLIFCKEKARKFLNKKSQPLYLHVLFDEKISKKQNVSYTLNTMKFSTKA